MNGATGGPCDGCGELGLMRVAECTFPNGGTLWLCEACDCGYIGGGEQTEELVDHYLLTIESEADRPQLREAIIEAHGRMPLSERGAKVAGLLARWN